MASANPFDLLGDDENDDPSLLIAAHQQKVAANKPAAAASPAAAKLPSKPLPPAQAVRESRSNTTTLKGGVGRGGVGRGRGGRGAGIGLSRDFGNGDSNKYGGGYRDGAAPENGENGKPLERERGGYGQPRGSFRGGRRGGYANSGAEGEFDPDRPQGRFYERRSGTGRGFEMKREGTGRGNWGTVTDDVLAQETEERVSLDEKLVVTTEKQVDQENGQGADARKDKLDAGNVAKEKEPEDNEMTLEEYEKVREEKRRSLLSIKAEARKVELDKDFESMQQLTTKKGDNDVFIKLGSDKDLSKRRDKADKDERTKKVMSINELLKPDERERYYNPGGRGRGRGRGDRETFKGGFSGGVSISPVIPSIEDQGQFPSLGTK